LAQKVQPIFAEIALTQTVTQMRISADRTGKDLMGELRAKLRSEKNFLRKLRCRAICTALHLSLCVLPYGIRKQPAHRLGGFGLRKRCDVSVSVKREASGVVAKHSGDSFDVHAVLQSQGCKCVPLRYNNDKQKKPLFSRGLSVCRLLFNSFSKLKIDENYKEKRRLFY